MADKTFTGNELIVLAILRVRSLESVFEESSMPWIEDAVRKLESLYLVERTLGDWGLTTRGEITVNAMLSLPLPVLTWTMPTC